MILKIAFRNLLRNRWRTVLTVAGVAAATALMTWTMAFTQGFNDMMVRGATAVETGQVQVQRADYVERSSIYKHFGVGDGLVEAVRGVEGVTAAAPRVRAFGLVGTERRSQIVRLLGVAPEGEQRVTVVAEGVEEGRWLATDPAPDGEPREAVLGVDLAAQLGVAEGDRVVIFLQAADGALGNDELEVVGVVRSGNTTVDRRTAYLHLADLQYLMALEGRAHELVAATSDSADAVVVAERIDQVLSAQHPMEDEGSLTVRAWQEIMPELHQMLELNDKSIWLMFIIVYLIAALGIANTQRMSALERRREFGVLLAVGLTPWQLARMIIEETVLIAVCGGVFGALIGTAVSYHHETAGFDLAALSDRGGFDFMGVAFSDRVYFTLTSDAVLTPMLIIVGVSVICGAWPAIKSARLDAVRAIAGRT